MKGVLIDTFNTSELVMARRIYHLLNPTDVVLADRAFGTYVDLVCVQAQKADAVFRCHQARKNDFESGQRLGEDDFLVNWYKPKKCPTHMSNQEFASLPNSIRVRRVRFMISQRGFRTKEVVLVTTLLDPQIYTKAKLAQLYRWRWLVEIDIRHVKTTLKMDLLRGKTNEMVRKEVIVHLMAYNLLRALMWQAALFNSLPIERVSFQATRQYLLNFITFLAEAGVSKCRRLYQVMLNKLGQKPLTTRPDRSEPRVLKRRQ